MTLSFAGVLHVVSSDPAAMLDFYRKLGFTPDAEGEALSLSLPDGFRVNPVVTAGSEGLADGEAVVVFFCDDLPAEYERLRSEGVEFLVPPVGPPGMREAHLRDPSGLWIMIVEKPDMPR